jgi:uncharacterized protein YrrD
MEGRVMPTLRSLEGVAVFDRKDRELGRVNHVLLHPSEPVVVGVEVQVPNALYVVSRPPRYIALRGLEVGEERIEAAEDVKEWSGARAEHALGFEWDSTVIWVGMPFLTQAGERLGYISDASFSLPGGELGEVLISEGLTSDVAVGTRTIDGSLVTGFDGSAVRVKDEAAVAQFSGGVAAKAGTNVGVAKVVLGEAGKTAAALGGKALKAAAGSKTAKNAWKVLKETGKAFREGQKSDDE